jgi:hypothetical protein
VPEHTPYFPSSLHRRAVLRLIHTYHAVPIPRPSRAAKVLGLPHLDFHSAAVFDSHMPCRAGAMPRPCRSESDFSRPLHRAAWAWHGMCELESAVQRRHVGDLPAFGFFRLPRGLSRRTSHCPRLAGARHDMCELTRHEWQGNGKGTVWARHGMCELAFTGSSHAMSYTLCS